MQLNEHKNSYISENEIFSFQTTLLDTISFKVFVECSAEKFLQYQKDILEEFVADFTSTIENSEELDTTDIKDIFEQSLQLLNTKLKQFADKVRDIERFQLKGLIQLVVDDNLMASMIGNVSLMILREQKSLYCQYNSIDNRTKIDLFSDFVEGKLERDDQILYVGLKFSDVMDNHDIKEMESLLSEEDDSEGVISFIEELLITRVEKERIGFIISYFVQGPTINIKHRNSGGLKLNGVTGKSKEIASKIGGKIQDSETLRNIKKQISENKIYVVGILLIILIIIFAYSLLSNLLSELNHTNQFQTSAGTYVDLNIDDIQKDINDFKTLPASDSTKTDKYNEISNELDFLNSNGKWLEDVKNLKDQLDESYYDGFKITQFTTENELNNIAGKNTQQLQFNSSDLSKIGTPNTIKIAKNMMIAGDKGAMIDASSDTNRGTIQTYGDISLNNCILSLNGNGLYCYNSDSIYLVTKSSVTPVGTADGDFRSGIGGLGTFGNSLYVFQSNVSSLGNMLLTRYQNNSDGTYANFKGGTSYSIAASGVDFGTFSSFAMDTNFFGRASGNLYFFWREDIAGTSLNYRKIQINGGNPLTDKYSNNVKIITSGETRYIYTYDKDQQLFTVYNTEKTKLNTDNKLSYQLVYLFSFKFNIPDVDVYDIDIPSSGGDRPELYILTSKGVNKISLYEYIDAQS